MMAAQAVPLPINIPHFENLQLSEPSLIDELNLSLPLIYSWLINIYDVHLELLFRGTEHGFTLPAFHSCIDGKGPLLFVVKSAQYNKVFGGYTSKPWTTPADTEQKFHYDHNAFIFSLTRKTKHMPFHNQHNAVQHFSTDSLFAFGWGDFGIKENCDQRDDNYSNFGVTKWTKYTYALPPNFRENSDESYRYFAGAHEFRVAEVEVYQVKTVINKS